MNHIVERDWITEAGLRATCLIILHETRRSHRCGYVELPTGHPLYGKKHSEPTDVIPQEVVDQTPAEKLSPILVITAGVRGVDGQVRRSPDLAFNVHGGLTYSGGDDYPLNSGGWWFGFDCMHCGDAPIELSEFDIKYGISGKVLRSLDYVSQECEQLARQITEMFRIREPK